jgi:hypothetical protein
MIKVSGFYPNGPAARFDMDYYCNPRPDSSAAAMRSVAEKASPAKKDSRGDSGSAPALVAMGSLVFDSFQAFEASFGRHRDEVVATCRTATITSR